MKKMHSIVVAGILFFCIGCGKGGDTKSFEQRHTVGRVSLRDVITQTGEVQPVVKVDLKSEASGRIDTVYVKEGQRVAKGDTIIVIDPSRLLLRKQRLNLSVKKARIDRDIAKRDLDNAQQLMHTGTISDRKLVDIKSKYDLADITYRQQLLELKDVQDELSKAIVTSPMDGVATTLDVEEGEIAVSATSSYSGGTAIATISDISRLEVVSQIGEVDYVHLQKGQNVVIRPEAIEGVFTTGTIDFIALTAKKADGDELGTFEVRIAIDSLIPGITSGINVNVEFVILEKSNVLGVPNHFVIKHDDKYLVTRVIEKNGTQAVRPLPIQVGDTDYRHYEVLSGLHEGDVIVMQEHRPGGDGRRRPPGGRGRR
jgi:HlyD family secretion protein